MQRLRRAYLVVSVVLTVVVGLLPSATLLAQDDPPVKSYGSQLFRLDPGAGQEAAIAALPLTVHGVLYAQDGPDRLIVSGSPELSAAAAAAGVPVELLDADTSGKAYYFVDAQAENAVSLATLFGALLYEDDVQLLLAAPLATEGAMLDALPSQGVSLDLLPPEGLPLPSEEPLEAASAAAVDAANPAVQALLATLTAGEIQTRIAQLSGVQTISTGSATVTLRTRYTFASNVRTVEQALFHQYQLLGYAPAFSNWSYGSYSGRNVVADLRGAVNPDRVWLVGGHFDSNSEVPYSSAPGADDNASGTAATLAIATALKDVRFADTIRFVGFGGEEQGKWGSISYARKLVLSGVQVIGFIDLDMIGWDGNKDRTVEIHSGTRSNSIAFAQRFLTANSIYGQGLRLELKQSSASRFSDHASFWDQGYASFMSIENFFDDAIPRDRNPYYHRTGDVLGRVDLDYVTRTARTALAMLAEGAGLLADGQVPTLTPTRTPSATPTPTRTPQPGACTELVANGGFEATSTWQFGQTATQGVYSTAQKRSGLRSARLGIVPAGATGMGEESTPGIATGERNLLGDFAPDAASYSSVYQTIAVPSSAERVTLTFWRRTGSEGGSGDFQRGLLLRPGTYALMKTIFRELTTATWREMSLDLTPYRGQSVVVYFEVYNDNTAAWPRAWMYLDDVSAQACPPGTYGGGGTPEPTPAATVEPAITPTETPIPPEPSTTPTPTVEPSVCGDRITNGSFELAAGWAFPATGNPAGYATELAHSGARSARVGVAPSAGSAGAVAGATEALDRDPFDASAVDAARYSSVSQVIALPAEAQTLRLNYWYWPGTDATTGNGDYQQVLLLEPGTNKVLKVLSKSLSSFAEWRQAGFDLSAYAGQSLVLYFGVYNDDVAAAPRTWMYVDDVSVTTCAPGVRAFDLGIPVWLPLITQ